MNCSLLIYFFLGIIHNIDNMAFSKYWENESCLSCYMTLLLSASFLFFFYLSGSIKSKKYMHYKIFQCNPTENQTGIPPGSRWDPTGMIKSQWDVSISVGWNLSQWDEIYPSGILVTGIPVTLGSRWLGSQSPGSRSQVSHWDKFPSNRNSWPLSPLINTLIINSLFFQNEILLNRKIRNWNTNL